MAVSTGTANQTSPEERIAYLEKLIKSHMGMRQAMPTSNIPHPSTGQFVDLTNAQTVAGVKTFSSAPILSSLSANQYVKTNGSKALASQSGVPYTDLTYSGLTATRVLKATSATAASFGQVDYTELTSVPSTFPATAHNLLSATHGDTAVGTVVRGDIIVGNSTPAWSRKALGTAGQVLQSDGTDVQWVTNIAGVSGGRTVTGGTASGNALTLQSTSHATKGNINIGTSIYDEVNQRLGIACTPGVALDVAGGCIRVQNLTDAVSGAGLELRYNTGTPGSEVGSFDRSAGTYKDYLFFGAVTTFQYQTTPRIKYDGTGIGFFNVTPVARQASGGTLAGVITGLTNLGLFSS